MARPGKAMYAAFAVFAVSMSAALAEAGTIYSVAISYDKYGHLDQFVVDMPHSTTGVLGGGANSCVPTAVTNSFSYLQKQFASVYGTSLVPGTAEATAENLGRNFMGTKSDTGTSGDGWIDGKFRYMESVAAGKTLYGAQTSAGFYTGDLSFVAKDTHPTWQFLYGALLSGCDIEIGIKPVDDIGHALTLSSFSWEDANDDGIIQADEKAIIDFIDPAAPGALSFAPISQAGAGGLIRVGYQGLDYNLVLAISEVAVPLPPAAYAGLAGMALVLVFRRKARLRAAESCQDAR